MRICGLQKLAMVDFPGKIAATVFTGGRLQLALSLLP